MLCAGTGIMCCETGQSDTQFNPLALELDI